MIKKILNNFLLLSFLFCLSSNAVTSKKLEPDHCQKIIAFTLYNYDNLITDFYEKKQPYLKQLAFLIDQASSIPEEVIFEQLRKNPDLAIQTTPLQLMLQVNKMLKAHHTYYFVDD